MILIRFASFYIICFIFILIPIKEYAIMTSILEIMFIAVKINADHPIVYLSLGSLTKSVKAIKW
jgi:hypothetical protein